MHSEGGASASTIATSLATIAAKSNTPYNSDNKLHAQFTDLPTYSKESSSKSIQTTDSVTSALGKLEYKTDQNAFDIATNTNNISSVQNIMSQTYNSADCNVSVFLHQDNGVTNESTYYNTSESKMHFRMWWSKNQFRYWDSEDGVWTYKYRFEYFGLIATNNAEKKDRLEINIPETANETYVKKSTNTDTQAGTSGGYAWNKSSVNVGDVWYIRPYIVMTDLQYGNQFVKYGAVYKVTAGVPCTIECDTLSCTELTSLSKQNQTNIAFLEATAEITGWHKETGAIAVVFDYAFSYDGTETVEYCFLAYREGDIKCPLTLVLKDMISGVSLITKPDSTGYITASDKGTGIYIRPYIKIGNRYKYGEQVFTTYADAPDLSQ